MRALFYDFTILEHDDEIYEERSDNWSAGLYLPERTCFYYGPQTVCDEDASAALLCEQIVDVSHKFRLGVCIECRGLSDGHISIS